MKTLRTLLVVVALSLGSAISHAGVIFETGPSTSVSPATSNVGPGHLIDVSIDTELTQIGFWMMGAGNAKFFVMNADGSEILSSSVVAFDEESLTWVYSNPFSFLLEAGESYIVGFVVDTPNATWWFGYHTNEEPVSQNGISSEDAAFFMMGYDNPTNIMSMGISAPFQLQGNTLSGEVPEPATYFAVGLGLGLIALYRRRQSQN